MRKHNLFSAAALDQGEEEEGCEQGGGGDELGSCLRSSHTGRAETKVPPNCPFHRGYRWLFSWQGLCTWNKSAFWGTVVWKLFPSFRGSRKPRVRDGNKGGADHRSQSPHSAPWAQEPRSTLRSRGWGRAGWLQKRENTAERWSGVPGPSAEEGRTMKTLPEAFLVPAIAGFSSTSRDWERTSEAANWTSFPAGTGVSKDTGVLWRPNDLKN